MYVRLPCSRTFVPYTPPESSSVTILYANLPSIVTPPILPPYVISNMGIGEFLHV